MVRCLHHRSLYKLDLRLLASALQLPSRCLELVPRGSQLSDEHGKIQQAGHDQQQGPAESQQRN